MEKLKNLREGIEKIDAAIIGKLAERQKLVKEIGQIKAESGLCVLDPTREAQLVDRYRDLCKEYELDPTFVQGLFEIIFSYSRSLQSQIS